MRVLAFEDGWDIAELLEREGVAIVDLELVQHWDTLDFLDKIREFAPDILLLDHFIPPTKGLEVLRQLNEAVSVDEMQRPELIVGMSSASMAKYEDAQRRCRPWHSEVLTGHSRLLAASVGLRHPTVYDGRVK